MRVLICGGAGYIGSHIAKMLASRGHTVTVLDNLCTGHREAVRWGPFFVADLMDESSLDRVFAVERFDSVLHLSASSVVADSAIDPYAYYRNNVSGTLNLLRAMHRYGVGRLIFSSTAAIYGLPLAPAIDEQHPQTPISPYGASKLMVERILQDAAVAYGLNSVSLRYFNAAGASPDGDIGEAHSPETHLIPNVLRAALPNGPPFMIFGDDHATPDGTCVRDYVHVDDIAHAHLLALLYLEDRIGFHPFNLGNGRGFSVREVVRAAEVVTGKRIPFSQGPRRAGDPPILIASSISARSKLGWRPKYGSIEEIVKTAWKWHSDPQF